MPSTFIALCHAYLSGFADCHATCVPISEAANNMRRSNNGNNGRRKNPRHPTESSPPTEEASSSSPPAPVYKAVEHGNRLDLPLVALTPFITCKLCRGYYVDVLTVEDCLHSFCKSCLLKHFDETDNTCPTCGNMIHQSHPTHYVRFDRQLQDIVYKIVPGMQEEEQRRRAAFWAKYVPDSSDSESERERAQFENLNTGTKALSISPCEVQENSGDCCKDNPAEAHGRDDESYQCTIMAEGEVSKQLDGRFIHASGTTPINCIKRYIALMIDGDEQKYANYDVFCRGELMGRDFSLAFIYKTRWRNNNSLPLQFTYRKHVNL
uniref:RING-type domain-containing protein n=1 Tax=Panagrellus redivivus TaxID=6233 RepID=A0A7E4USY2_PANRE